MGKTANYNLPYPENTDKANVPQDLKNLAEQAEAALDKKVNKEDGKRLITNTEAEKLAGLSNYDDTKLQETLTNQDRKIEELEEELETLYGDFEPNTVSGEVATINDGVDNSRVEVQGDGNSYQDTREGYQLLPIPDIEEKTVNGVTYSIKNGVLTLNGTSTSGFDIWISGTSKVPTMSLSSGEYTFCATDIKGTFKGTVGKYIRDTVTGTNIIDGNLLGFFAKRTLESDFPSTSSYIFVANGSVFTNYSCSLMLLKGTYTESTLPPYEQYGSMPSTEFKSDIEVIDMVNNFDISKITEGKSLSSGNVSNNSTVSNLSDYMPVRANKTYNFAYEFTELLNTSVRSYCLYDSNKTFIKGSDYNPATKKYQITPTQDGYIRFSYDINCKDIMFYEGTDDKPYLPYGSIGLLQRGKNYFDLKDKVTDYNCSGILVTTNKNRIKYNGTNTTGDSINPNKWEFAPLKYELPAGDYIFTLKKISGSYNKNGKTDAMYIRDKDKNEIKNLSTFSYFIENNHQVKFTNPKTQTILFQHYCNAEISFDNFEFEIQIEKDNGNATEIVEPISNLIPIDLQGNTLAKVGDIKDLLNIGLDGSVSIEKETGRDNLENATWTSAKSNDGTNKNRYHTNYLANKIKANTKVLCDKFIGATNYGYLFVDNYITNTPSASISCYIEDIQTLENWNAWFKENGLDILYPLAKSETINLPSIKPITLFEGTNNFELVTNLDTTLAVNYRVSNNKRLKALESALVSLGGI